MARDIIIQIRLPRLSVRKWLAISAAVCVLGAGAVYAKVNWTPFVGGSKLTSQQLNDNFKALGDAIDVLQMQPAPVLPHMITDSGKVDLGIYLGPWNFIHPQLKAPIDLQNWASQINFTKANCTGEMFVSGVATT